MQLLMWTLMLRLHPKPLIYTPSYEYSVSFAGVAFGVATGLRRAKHLHSTGALLQVLWEQGGALAIVRRLALGVPSPPQDVATACCKPSQCMHMAAADASSWHGIRCTVRLHAKTVFLSADGSGHHGLGCL